MRLKLDCIGPRFLGRINEAMRQAKRAVVSLRHFGNEIGRRTPADLAAGDFNRRAGCLDLR